MRVIKALEMWLPPLMLAACVAAHARTVCSSTTEPWREEADLVFGKPNTTASAPTPATTEEPLNLKPTVHKGTSCKMESGATGECVVYYQCNSVTKEIILDGNSLIDIRLADLPCPKYLDVCCGRPDVNRTQPPVPSGGAQCGYSNPGASGTALRGGATEYAQFAEFPWMVAILKKTDKDVAFTPKNYVGGGSLIHPRVVLTSAHKVDGLEASALVARAGEWDTQTEQEIYPHQQRDVDKIAVHEDFYRPSVLNSVALLFMTSPFELAPHVDVVCLAHAPPPPGTPCFSMGWGKEDFAAVDKYAVFLKKVPVPMVSRTRCQTALRGTRVGTRFVLHASFVCAGGLGGQDTCLGDGGAPLVCPIGAGRFAQVGAVAWGIGCGDEGVPGVYADVTRFRGWVAERMRDEGLQPTTYEYEQEKPKPKP